jgi:hypothetical protein
MHIITTQATYTQVAQNCPSVTTPENVSTKGQNAGVEKYS